MLKNYRFFNVFFQHMFNVCDRPVVKPRKMFENIKNEKFLIKYFPYFFTPNNHKNKIKALNYRLQLKTTHLYCRNRA